MAGRIFHLNDNGDATPLEERCYDAEKTLQELLAKHPDLLAGEQIQSSEPRRWLLVAREMAVQGEDDSPRWSLDHLFLDQDAVPTLVEVKQSTNADIRRKVVGQMLDYAANAVVRWSVEEIRAKYEARCHAAGIDPDEELGNCIGDCDNPEVYWQRVKTNLQAGKIRLIFVSDRIPAELRRIVEFLNKQMDPAEVLAVEIKQYVGEGMKTLVPRVVGQTTAKEMRSQNGRQWDEASFFQTLRERSGVAQVAVARKILDWAEGRSLRIRWGKGNKDGSFRPMLEWRGKERHTFVVRTSEVLRIRFSEMSRQPPFDDESKREQLRERLNRIPGVDVPPDRLASRPEITFAQLSDDTAMSKFLEAMDWYVQEVRSAWGGQQG